MFPLARSLDTVGPMTRTVAENAAVLNVIAGHDPLDPASKRVDVPDFARDLDQGVRGLKIRVVRHFYQRDSTADSSVMAALDAALGVFAALGAELLDCAVRPLDVYTQCNRTLLMSEGYALHERWLRTRPNDYAALTRERLSSGASISAADHALAVQLRAELTAEMEHTLAATDVLVTASSLEPPCRIDDRDALARVHARHAFAPFNLTGHPAIAIPCGFSGSGLPLSLQIAGKAFDEVTVYRVANAYEGATRWKDHHPSL